MYTLTSKTKRNPIIQLIIRKSIFFHNFFHKRARSQVKYSHQQNGYEKRRDYIKVVKIEEISDIVPKRRSIAYFIPLVASVYAFSGDIPRDLVVCTGLRTDLGADNVDLISPETKKLSSDLIRGYHPFFHKRDYLFLADPQIRRQFLQCQ